MRVSEIIVLKSTQKGLPALDSDASYNCGFSKGKWPSVSRHDGAETVGGLPSRRRVFSHDYIFRIVSILFIARRCHQSGNSDWT